MAASRFVLSHEDEHGDTRVVAEGEALVRRALADQTEA